MTEAVSMANCRTKTGVFLINRFIIQTFRPTDDKTSGLWSNLKLGWKISNILQYSMWLAVPPCCLQLHHRLSGGVQIIAPHILTLPWVWRRQSALSFMQSMAMDMMANTFSASLELKVRPQTWTNCTIQTLKYSTYTPTSLMTLILQTQISLYSDKLRIHSRIWSDRYLSICLMYETRQKNQYICLSRGASWFDVCKSMVRVCCAFATNPHVNMFQGAISSDLLHGRIWPCYRSNEVAPRNVIKWGFVANAQHARTMELQTSCMYTSYMYTFKYLSDAAFTFCPPRYGYTISFWRDRWRSLFELLNWIILNIFPVKAVVRHGQDTSYVKAIVSKYFCTFWTFFWFQTL